MVTLKAGIEMWNKANEWTLSRILNRVQILSTDSIYSYNKLERINSKPLLQAGSENLREYNVSLQLHSSFCNPKEIIQLIEDQAASRTPFNWNYNSEYMGTFVIDSIKKVIQNQVKGFIIYAEVIFNLLESPDDEEFKEQLNNKPEIDEAELYGAESNKFKDFTSKVKSSITQNMNNAVATSLVSDNLSDAAKELLSEITSAVIKDTSGVNISELYNKADYWADKVRSNSSLELSDIEVLYQAVKSIPDIMLLNTLRGVNEDKYIEPAGSPASLKIAGLTNNLLHQVQKGEQ